MAAKVITNFIAKALFKQKGAIANRKAVDFSANALENRLKNLGIDPNAIKSEQELNQILAYVKQAEDQAFQQRFGDMLAGSRFDKQADVLDMTGKKIDPRSKIMGGKQAETEAEIAERLGRENKESAARIKNQKLIKDAVDNASPGFVRGDRKYNAQLVADDLAQKKFGKDFYDLDQKQQMDLYGEALDGLSVDPDKFAQGGRAGYKFGIGPLFKLLSKKSPKQAYTDYLKSVKDRAQKGDMKSLAPELGAVSAAGIFVNRRMKDVLENMKNQDMENNLENFRKELDADPFYEKYPELKDKMIEGYTEMMFGEKKADGGIMRVGLKSGSYDYDSFEHKINELNAHFKRYKKKGGTLTFKQFAPLFAAENFATGGRAGFKDGMDRRTFLKIMGGLASIPILGKFFKGAKVVSKAAPVAKTVSKSEPPPYFFELAETIKKFGRVSDGPQERIKIHSMKAKDGKSELMLTEDIGTGEMQIKKIGKENDEMISEVQTMDYAPSSALSDESGKVAGQYDEYTEYNSRIYKDEYNEPDIVDGIKVDEIINEVKEAPSIKKAAGGIAKMLGE